MNKRRPSMTQAQLGFSFETPRPASFPADLAGLERIVAAGVALALKDDSRSRDEIAGAVSALLDDNISKFMIDGYASESRDRMNISAGRFLALIAATGRFDVLDKIMRHIGVSILVGDEIQTAQIGNLEQQMRALNTKLRELKARAPIIIEKGR